MEIQRAIDILTPGNTRFTPKEYEIALNMARAALAFVNGYPVPLVVDMRPFSEGEIKAQWDALQNDSQPTGIMLGELFEQDDTMKLPTAKDFSTTPYYVADIRAEDRAERGVLGTEEK